MFTIAFVALLSTAQVSPVALPDTTLRVASASRVIAPTVSPDVTTAADHIAAARQAQLVGDFDLARREFVIAAALDRDAGKLPVDATIGLANVLYARSFNREAAMALDRLAAEAAERGASDVEARALMDAIWLNIDAGNRAQARLDGLRLQELIKERALSSATMKLVNERYR